MDQQEVFTFIFLRKNSRHFRPSNTAQSLISPVVEFQTKFFYRGRIKKQLECAPLHSHSWNEINYQLRLTISELTLDDGK